MFTGVYCRGNKEEKDLLWRELYECKRKGEEIGLLEWILIQF